MANCDGARRLVGIGFIPCVTHEDGHKLGGTLAIGRNLTCEVFADDAQRLCEHIGCFVCIGNGYAHAAREEDDAIVGRGIGINRDLVEGDIDRRLQREARIIGRDGHVSGDDGRAWSPYQAESCPNP